MEWDAIRNRARADLVISTERGDEDMFLWEHSCRVAQNANRISMLPEVQSAQPDTLAVVAGALYHDAAWIGRIASGEVQRNEVLTASVADNHSEQSARILEESLSRLLPADSLQCASYAIRTIGARDSDSIEGQIITDANELEEFGGISLWTTIRRGVSEGKGVQAVLDMWRRRYEFRFWEARLNKAFRFDSVRETARRRLELLERFMAELEDQNKGADI
jgi:HD superfamily phosphodiesterase